MGYFYSDPTAAAAVGNITKERNALVKKARVLRKMLEEGRLSPAELERARSQFTGIHKHVLDEVLKEEPKDRRKKQGGSL